MLRVVSHTSTLLRIALCWSSHTAHLALTLLNGHTWDTRSSKPSPTLHDAHEHSDLENIKRWVVTTIPILSEVAGAPAQWVVREQRRVEVPHVTMLVVFQRGHRTLIHPSDAVLREARIDASAHRVALGDVR